MADFVTTPRVHDGGRIVPCCSSSKDGMDQAKWSVPRGRQNRLTKSEMPLIKPRFKIEGCWILGLISGWKEIGSVGFKCLNWSCCSFSRWQAHRSQDPQCGFVPLGVVAESCWRCIDGDRDDDEDHRVCHGHVQGAGCCPPKGAPPLGVLVQYWSMAASAC